MAKPIPENDLKAIKDVLKGHPEGINLKLISDALGNKIPPRTLQYHLRYLRDKGTVVAQGERRATKYFIATLVMTRTDEASTEAEILSLSDEAKDIQQLVSRPLIARKIVGYNKDFLNAYIPNESSYLSPEERVRLHAIGAVPIGTQPAGTYARKVLGRLLIDLSWNSSRLEGNTYTLLDTKRLIDFGKEAEGKERLDAQMILNHKDAIEFLVGSAEEIGFNRYTILNLHGLLANNLLSNPQAAGRLRYIAVAIEQAAFQPLEVPQVIEECFDKILNTASAISDPFEQSFFVMVHLPYLQAFDDVNKRVSRLAANIPFIKANLIPLTFSDVPKELYTRSILGVYELNRIELLRDIYLWAYQRSAELYAAVRQSLGEPDPFRLKYREGLRYVVSTIVRNQYNRETAVNCVEKWAAQNVPEDERMQFVDIAETEILGLHEGNFARYQVRPSEFNEWYNSWKRKL